MVTRSSPGEGLYQGILLFEVGGLRCEVPYTQAPASSLRGAQTSVFPSAAPRGVQAGFIWLLALPLLGVGPHELA